MVGDGWCQLVRLEGWARVADLSHSIADGVSQQPGGSGRFGRRHVGSLRPGARAEFLGLWCCASAKTSSVSLRNIAISFALLASSCLFVVEGVTKSAFERHVWIKEDFF